MGIGTTKRYCIWNNKGGVGKTFLTYLLATEYAHKHSDEDVVIVDMCPQSNVSEIVLGGNGTGQKNLEDLTDKERTIAFYIKERYNKKDLLGTETTYFIHAKQYNKHIPRNVYLLPGDVDLDICTGIINYMALSPDKLAWKKSRRLLGDLLDSFERRDKRPKTFFIDCNPSFAPYTELAVLATNALIVPCTADNASIRGMNNIFKLFYGDGEEQFINFADNVKNYGLALPRIHHVVLNKSRSHQKNTAKAFTASRSELDKRLNELKGKHPEAFFSSCPSVHNIKDGNTLATVINHEGCLLSNISQGAHNVYDQQAQVNKDQIDELQEDVMEIVDRL